MRCWRIPQRHKELGDIKPLNELEIHLLAQWSLEQRHGILSLHSTLNRKLQVRSRNLFWTNLPGVTDTLEFGGRGPRPCLLSHHVFCTVLAEWMTYSNSPPFHFSKALLPYPNHLTCKRTQGTPDCYREILILIQHKVNSRHPFIFQPKN